jgi:hypothetical protein
MCAALLFGWVLVLSLSLVLILALVVLVLIPIPVLVLVLCAIPELELRVGVRVRVGVKSGCSSTVQSLSKSSRHSSARPCTAAPRWTVGSMHTE